MAIRPCSWHQRKASRDQPAVPIRHSDRPTRDSRDTPTVSARLVKLPDEIADVGIHDIAPAPSAEDAVVARALDLEMRVLRLRNGGAEIVRGRRLAEARDVVELAFDRQQRGLLDVFRCDALAVD